MSGAGGTAKSWALASTLLGSCLWGVNAVVVQFLLEAYSLSPLELVAIRMPISGLILFAFFRPSRPTTRLGAFVAFSILGLWLVQSTYFLTIAASNAATGTLLQFVALPMIAAYEIGSSRMRATASGILAVVLATIGTAELAAGSSNGSLALVITPLALVAGLVSAACVAYYIIQSKSLIAEYGYARVTTWGFLFGSVVAVPAGLFPVSVSSSALASGGPVELAGLIAFMVVGGTLLTFLLYFKGLEKITPTEAGIVAAMEPITAAILSFAVLHVVLTPFQYLGGLLIIGAVALITLRTRLSP